MAKLRFDDKSWKMEFFQILDTKDRHIQQLLVKIEVLVEEQIHGDQTYVEVGVLGEAFSSTTSTSASVLEDKRFRKQYPIAIGMAFLCFKLGYEAMH